MLVAPPEIKKMGRLARRNANRKKFKTTPAWLSAPRHAAMAGLDLPVSAPATAVVELPAASPRWSTIRVRHAEAMPATGAWQRRVEAAEKGIGWTGRAGADVVERRTALLTLNVDTLESTCAEELSLVTAACPPNGLAVVWPPGRKEKAGEQVGVAMVVLCGALACPCEGRLANEMREVDRVVRATNWVEVMASWGRGLHGVGESGSKDKRRGHYRFGGGWAEMIDTSGTEPLAAGGQTYPRRAVGHRHSAAFFRLTLPVIAALLRCAYATPYLAPHTRRMR